MKKRPNQLSRRQVLSWLTGTAAGLSLNRHQSVLKMSYAQSGELPKFFIVMGCSGGASIIDGPLAVRSSEVNQAQLNSFADDRVYSRSGSDLRATRVDVNGLGAIPYRGQFDQRAFLDRHHDDMAVLTYTGTSVNHLIAQKERSQGMRRGGRIHSRGLRSTARPRSSTAKHQYGDRGLCGTRP